MGIDSTSRVCKLHGVKITRNHMHTMTKADLARKARQFRAALLLANTTAEAWAETESVTAGHLSQVLSGKRESRSLMERIEAFTKKHVRAA